MALFLPPSKIIKRYAFNKALSSLDWLSTLEKKSDQQKKKKAVETLSVIVVWNIDHWGFILWEDHIVQKPTTNWKQCFGKDVLGEISISEGHWNWDTLSCTFYDVNYHSFYMNSILTKVWYLIYLYINHIWWFRFYGV